MSQATPSPTQIAVDRTGVYPTNQVCSFRDVVPVLPAAGNGGGLVPAVPLQTFCRAWFTAFATRGSRAPGRDGSLTWRRGAGRTTAGIRRVDTTHGGGVAEWLKAAVC